ncbi:MAG: SDR family NAD(P)-dependent oxidoreductase [Mycobacterium sp.]|nr:SDR family NAD(P)-dependent oxidoreductase [Mycobacterium sp.]
MSARELFSGGVAVITGAGAGIGTGLTRHASRLGMTVVLADVDGGAIAALRDELCAAGGAAVDVVCDVRDPDAVQELAEKTYRDVGPVRLLVNNAGVEQFGYLWDTPVENWNRVVDINITGVFHGVRAFIPKMLASREPAWVWNLSSIGGVATVPLQASYIMSKHAVLALTECLRLEVQLVGHDHHLHVQAVLPGAVASNIFESAGGVTDGDIAAAESQRSAMLDIKADAMDSLSAAEAVFDQAAEGRFYLLTQPEYVGSAMAERAEVLASQRPPELRGRRFNPAPVRLDPDAAARVASFGDIPPMRQRGLATVREAIESAPLPEAMPEMAVVEDCAALGPAVPIPLRIYRPTRAANAPVLLYFHGGGMVLGSNHSFEPLARALAAASDALVVAVDYRLAPENPPPAQFDDAYCATAWVADNADRLGVDPARLAVVGDSAGGSLAAAVALAARDRDGPPICCQVLLYPGLDRDMGAPSITGLADAPMLSLDDINYMHELADRGAGAPHDAYRVPAYAADLSGLPPAIVVTAECDSIRDWGERYANRLRDARVQVTVTRYPGVYHGFLMRSDATARGSLAIAEVGALLRTKFAHLLPF